MVANCRGRRRWRGSCRSRWAGAVQARPCASSRRGSHGVPLAGARPSSKTVAAGSAGAGWVAWISLDRASARSAAATSPHNPWVITNALSSRARSCRAVYAAVSSALQPSVAGRTEGYHLAESSQPSFGSTDQGPARLHRAELGVNLVQFPAGVEEVLGEVEGVLVGHERIVSGGSDTARAATSPPPSACEADHTPSGRFFAGRASCRCRGVNARTDQQGVQPR